jgi:hypothetical protein
MKPSVLSRDRDFIGSAHLRQALDAVQDRSAGVPHPFDLAQQHLDVLDDLLGGPNGRFDPVQVVGVRKVLLPNPVQQ